MEMGCDRKSGFGEGREKSKDLGRIIVNLIKNVSVGRPGV